MLLKINMDVKRLNRTPLSRITMEGFRTSILTPIFQISRLEVDPLILNLLSS